MQNRIAFRYPVTLPEVVDEMVKAAGKDPATVYAVFDMQDAALAHQRPERMSELLVLFTDWTFMRIDSSGLVKGGFPN